MSGDMSSNRPKQQQKMLRKASLDANPWATHLEWGKYDDLTELSPRDALYTLASSSTGVRQKTTFRLLQTDKLCRSISSLPMTSTYVILSTFFNRFLLNRLRREPLAYYFEFKLSLVSHYREILLSQQPGLHRPAGSPNTIHFFRSDSQCFTIIYRSCVLPAMRN